MDTRRVDFDAEAVEALRAEFFARIDPADHVANMQSLLTVPGRQMYSRGNPVKGGDLYTIRNSDVLVGVLLNKYYAWDKIRPQLNFRPRIDRGLVDSFSLASFESMLPSGNHRRVVGELAYFWVNPAYRGHGIGTQLFDLSLKEFNAILKRDEVVFTLAMGCFSGNPVGPELQRYLLDKERQENGARSDGSTIVTGVEVSAMRILKDHGIDVTRLTTSPGSKATEILARKRGFCFRGYSKNLSILYTRP